MAQFAVLTAVAAPFGFDNVDTDQIFPSRFSSKDRSDGQFGAYFLKDLRFDENNQKREGFVLNDARLSNTKIIVAAANYACGSARAGAIYAHLDYGIQAVVAESFGPVFPTVAYKSGLLTLTLEKAAIKDIRDQLAGNLGAQITIDLVLQRIIAPDGRLFPLEIDPFLKRIFVEGISEIDLTLSYREKIEAYEKRLESAFPWIAGPVKDRRPG